MTNRVDALRRLHPRLSDVSTPILSALLTPPADLNKVNCWLEALLVLLDTGDIIETIKKLITCLTAMVGQASVFACLMKAIFALVGGAPMEVVIVDFIKCLLSNDNPSPPPPGDIDPPSYQEVPRCD